MQNPSKDQRQAIEPAFFHRSRRPKSASASTNRPARSRRASDLECWWMTGCADA